MQFYVNSILDIQDDARVIVTAEQIAAANGTYTHTARSAGQRCERGLSSKSKVCVCGRIKSTFF